MNVTFNAYPKNQQYIQKYMKKPSQGELVQHSNLSFNGITRQMNKHIYIDGQKDIKKIIDEHEGRSLHVGQCQNLYEIS